MNFVLNYTEESFLEGGSKLLMCRQIFLRLRTRRSKSWNRHFFLHSDSAYRKLIYIKQDFRFLSMVHSVIRVEVSLVVWQLIL